MAFEFKIQPNGSDRHEIQPYWLLVFIPFEYRDTFTRDFTILASENSNEAKVFSKAKAKENPVKTKDMIFADNDCVNWHVVSDKGTFTSSAEFTLNYSSVDYSQVLGPQDWVLFWAFDNYADYKRIKEKVLAKKRANKFPDGFKFMGRVDSIRKNKSINPFNGQVNIAFNVSCQAFSEFNSIIYYNEMVARDFGGNFMQAWEKLAGSLNKVIINGNIHTGDIIPLLVRICLGLGPPLESKGADVKVLADLASVSAATVAANSDLIASPNSIYRAPPEIRSLLLGESPTNPVLTYVDLLRQYIGIQKYSRIQSFSADDSDVAWNGFIFDINKVNNNEFYGHQLTGDYLPMPINFNGKSVWSILSTFHLDAINEMFTTFRVDPEGYVMPSFILRQLPFSSDKFVKQNGLGTAFSELPRWTVDESMVYAYDLGRSDAERFNYVHVMGTDIGNNKLNPILQYAYNKPIVDIADIERSGLKWYSRTVNAKIIATQFSQNDNPGDYWNKLLADYLMGGHLKFNGYINMPGVQAPIALGDNLKFNDVLYHIRGITHSGGIDMNGQKVFNTNLRLVNGVAIRTVNDDPVYPDEIGADSTVGITSEKE